MRWWLLVGLLAVSLGRAETFVVAAGIEQYDDPEISALRYSTRDATAMVAAFRAAGVPDANLVLLTSGAADRGGLPTKFNLLHSLQRVREKARAADTLIFFFAGHGMEKDGEAYLMTIDSIREQLAETALPMSLIQSMLRGFEAERVLFIIDACRNDPTAGRAEGDARLDDSFARSMRPQLTGAPDRQPTAALLLACEVGQRAWEMPEAQHGAFTWFLLQGLAGEAKGDDGQVHLTALAEYLTREVPAWARRAGREQTPRFDNPTGGDFVLLTPPTAPVVEPPVGNPPREPVTPPRQPGARPADWPEYLADFQPPAGLTWADFRVVGPDRMPQVLLRGGEFTMGSDNNSRLARTDERPARPIVVSEYWMDLHEVTMGQYAQFVKETNYEAGRDFERLQRDLSATHPVAAVSWDDAVTYAQWAGRRLPSEAQFEYAARAGSTTEFPWGDAPDPRLALGTWSDTRAPSIADAGRYLQPVAGLPPNAFGLFDLIGSLREWCQDAWMPLYYREMPAVDPVAPGNRIQRSVRGGSWADDAQDLRPAARAGLNGNQRYANVGFRLVSVE